MNFTTAIQNNDVLILRDEVNALLRISDTTRQRLEKSDPSFPTKIKVSKRRVAFWKSDVLAYAKTGAFA